jgi:hypothetical protein
MSLTIEEVFNLANERWNRKGSNDPIKESTMKSYKSGISKLIKELEAEEDKDYNWCFDCEKTIDHINNSSRSNNSKKTIYSYLEIFMRGLSPDWKGLEQITRYNDEKKKLQENIDATAQKNKEECGMALTDKQKENILDKKDLEVYVKTLTNKIKQIAKKENPDLEDLKQYTIYILINTWLRLPIRNELWNMYFLRDNKYDPENDIQPDKDKNWFILTKDSAYIIRNVYKTAGAKKNGGTKIYKLHSDLIKIYKKYFKFANIYITPKYKQMQNVFPYFNDYNNGNIEISRLISNEFKKETGKCIASTLLMKIIFQLNEEQNEAIKYIKWLSMMRGTSMDVLATNYL